MKKYLHDIVKNQYQYEIIKNKGEGMKGYGYTLIIYINGKENATFSAFGSVSMAEAEARNYFLQAEFNIEREY